MYLNWYWFQGSKGQIRTAIEVCMFDIWYRFICYKENASNCVDTMVAKKSYKKNFFLFYRAVKSFITWGLAVSNIAYYTSKITNTLEYEFKFLLPKNILRLNNKDHALMCLKTYTSWTSRLRFSPGFKNITMKSYDTKMSVKNEL